MAFSPFLVLITFLFLLTSSLSLSSPPLKIHLTHLHSSQNYSKLQLLQHALARSKARVERLSMMATMQSPVFSGQGEFLMNISIGTPPKPFSAILDTGSDLIWTQCSPCTKCFDQPTPVFDPKNSSSYSAIPCSSQLCKDMNIFRCDNGCKYLYTYGDQSSSQGYMAMETFTFLDSTNSKPMSVPNIGFGCGVNNQGSGFGQGSGLVGLGRGPLSLISQLGFKKFSYCLTSIGDNKTSSLLLGSLADFNYSTSSSYAKWTPLIQSSYQPTFYYLDLQGISVGETLLPISDSLFKLREDGSGGMIIDSGTTISYIQEDAFEMLKKEFSSQMMLRVTKSDSGGLDLCFDLPTNDISEIKVPKLKFHFKGVDLELPVENYMIADINMGLVCLGMAASNSMSILGNVQQQNFLVLHDLETESLSFVPTQCDQL
ncbi:hypothetical protein DCAR_0519903 [Daucus carota subsp. sativus]|uniref:Peptidase A1 domain-containing protein n=2 Tax=Daucus carota subsp. sativus TaxID=79200 RepID=A0AAF0X4R1_DAUCS|nr:PREDICTED: aspartic proteinase nepenthesin-1-like [Daucus carota subsp. sativus]WOH00537.1 hypothetical protein DCAR_0519903 [Daucus carota subsp. sativus]